MKVVVDCRGIHPDKSGGIDTYANIIIEGLARKGVEVVIDASFLHHAWYINYFSSFKNITVISDPLQKKFYDLSNSPKLIHKSTYLLLRVLNRILRILNRNILGRRNSWATAQNADVVFYPFHLHRPQHFHLPMVTIIHAVLPHYGKDQIRDVSNHINIATAITVSWPFPYDDLISRYPSVKDKLFMIPITTSQNLDSGEDIDLSKLGVANKFLFYPAVLSKRKNHGNLIRAYRIARECGYELPQLVFSGGGDDFLQKSLEALSDEIKIKDKIIFLGYVGRDVIANLYRKCLGTVSSSLWEAGIVTIQEGGYCGKPAACSDIPPARAHANLLNFKVCFFDPLDPNDIANKLISFVDNIDEYRKSAEDSSKIIHAMDLDYLGSCYSNVLSYAAGLQEKPNWAPYKVPYLNT